MLNVVVLLDPFDISPVSHTPVSLVEVWMAPSLFFHVIVVPFFIVRELGEKESPVMTTVFGGGGDPDDDPPYEFDGLLLQPTTAATTDAITISARYVLYARFTKFSFLQNV